MTRFICLNCTCVLILIHHLALRPFRNRKANILESLSLASLVAICTFSLTEATYLSEGLEPIGPSESLFHALQWLEIGLLSLAPIAVCIFLAFAALSQVFRLLYLFIRCLSSVMRCKCFSRHLSLGHYSFSQELLFECEPAELQCVA